MKLYRAKLSTEIVFVSEDGYNENALVLRKYASSEIEKYGILETVDEIFELSDIPKGWLDSIPYGLLPKQITCRQLIPTLKKAKRLKDLKWLKLKQEELQEDIERLEKELETL